MRTNSSSSFGSSIDIENAVSPTSSTSAMGDVDQAVYTKLKGYGKFFTTKLLQVLVQSRANERHDQPCIGTKAPATWFNVNIDELGEVSAQVKRNLPKYPPEVDSMSVDFFLYTADSETLPLESWMFHINRDVTIRADGKSELSELYHQLSTLLKSTMAASRMTPMYRYYVKKQSAETFVILYKIQSGPTAVDLGQGFETKVVGSFPSPLGAFTLTLSYRTRMEIEQKLAASIIGISPDTAAEESFQKVESFSSGNTPDYDHVANSPRSMDAISHFSVSPPLSQSPGNPSFLRGFSQRSRSRTCSLASEPDIESASPKDKMHASHSLSTIPKNMPFANLLTLSYTGSLGPLRSVPEEKNKRIAEEVEPTEEETVEEEKSSEVERRSDDTISVDLEHSQQTVVDDVMNETMKPPSGEKDESEEDDSFVKIPIFGVMDKDDCQGLSELLNNCKVPLKIESFGDDDVHSVLTQLDNFSSNQGIFDQFLSSVREIVGTEASS